MESDGGGVATAVTSRRLSSQHSTLRDTFIASDRADALNREFADNSTLGNIPTSPRRRGSNLTLGAVLNNDKKSPANVVVRTLLEIIRNDETLAPGSAGGNPNGKRTWKYLKERLKLKKNQNQSQDQYQYRNSNSQRWESSFRVPRSDVEHSSRSSSIGDIMANRNSLRSSSLRRVDTVPADDLTLREVDSGGSPRSGGSFRLSAALAAEREQTRRRLSRELDEGNGNRDDSEESDGTPRGNVDDDEDENDEEDGEGIANVAPTANQPMRMSLMDLLEETDRQAGISGPTYRLDDAEEEEEEEVEEVAVEHVGKGEYSCCVCMVRHKGAAFIPCGHTFCRLCSRELFVQRGNCPLCNNFILEILDIF